MRGQSHDRFGSAARSPWGRCLWISVQSVIDLGGVGPLPERGNLLVAASALGRLCESRLGFTVVSVHRPLVERCLDVGRSHRVCGDSIGRLSDPS